MIGPESAIFFICLLIVVNYMLLNLGVALLIGSFDQSHNHRHLRLSNHSGDGGESSHSEDDRDGGESGATSPAYAELPMSGKVGGEGLVSSMQRGVHLRFGVNLAHHDSSLGLFKQRHPLRQAARSLVNASLPGMPALSFDNAILVLIVTSSLAMAFDSCELDRDSPLASALARIDQLALSAFVLELLAKVISLGLR